MVGMLEIITYLLSVYLIFKGIEIYQIAKMSTREERSGGLTLGTIMIIISIVAALVFSAWITMQAESIGNSTPRFP
jgi:uncharacterized membrane protein